MRRTKSGKGLIRATNRASTKSGKTRPAEAAHGRPSEAAACESCGAIFSRRVWRRRPPQTALEQAGGTRCPACRQADAGIGCGRVVIRGPYAAAHADAVWRRIANVTARASHTQPERRVSSIARQGDVLELVTTSQKLAHRIVRELVKAFGGRATYRWSDDATLLATWQR